MQECPQKLIKAIERAHGGLKDDTSIIVLDLLPPDKDFPAIAGRTKQHKLLQGLHVLCPVGFWPPASAPVQERCCTVPVNPLTDVRPIHRGPSV